MEPLSPRALLSPRSFLAAPAQLSGLAFLPASSAQLRGLKIGELLAPNSRYEPLLMPPLHADTPVSEILGVTLDEFSLVFRGDLIMHARSLHRLLTTLDAILVSQASPASPRRGTT